MDSMVCLQGVKQVPTVPQQHEMGMSPRSPSERAPLPRAMTPSPQVC